MTTFENISGN